MNRSLWIGTASVLSFVFLLNTALEAQGITSSAVSGRISGAGRGPLEGAIVSLTHTGTGSRQQTTTRAGGVYNFENIAAGGPYRLEARAIGFQPGSKSGILTALGQRSTQHLELAAQAVTLQEVTVTAVTDPLINTGRTGAAQVVGDTTIQRLPLLGRNFTDLLKTSPQVVPVQSGTSIGGQNNRFNAILIDGGVNNDIFGLSSSGTPGGSSGAKPISLEAVQEFQILIAPFDIRQGSFSGGLVNAVTKSGTNSLRGSAYSYFQRPELVGKDTAGNKFSNFDIKQYGATIGGPIIRNRLHFFGSADLQESTTPFVGLSAEEPATGITVATATRIQDIIKAKYGFDPGGVEAPNNLARPDRNLFGKLNWQIGGGSQLELSYNYVRASQDNFNRSSRTDPTRDGWQLSNSGFRIGSTTKSLRSKFTSMIAGADIEVLLGYQTVRDAREIANAVPLIMVQGDVTSNYLGAGGERFSHGNELDQDNLEFTANLTFGLGASHRITVGTHNEFFSFRNLFANNRYGTWTFGSADSLDANLPRRYEILLEARPGGFTADFGVRQLGGYAQDTWRPNDRVTITAGLRFDVPLSDKPFGNPSKSLTDTLGVHTDQFPSGNVLWSPRLGFNYDVLGDASMIIRGGIGIFTGRPPYVWMANAFTNTGLEQVSLICGRPENGSAPPPLITDVGSLPRACLGQGEPSPPTATVNYFESGFRFQQALKYAFGIDQRLPWGVVGTIDLVQTAGRNQMYQVDDNVRLGAVNGEGRQLYGSPNPAGNALTRLTKANGVRQVIRHTNRRGDKATAFTVQLQKSFADRLSFGASYTRSHTRDLMALGSSTATSNLRNTPIDGTLEERNLRTAGQNVPHGLAIHGTANLPFGLQASALFTARAGTPYAYVAANDANGDGIVANDLFYVPRDANDIALAAPADWDRLNAFIVKDECLRTQRGRIMERNSCRNPGQKFLDIRIGKAIRTISGQSLQLTADVFNVLNLVDKDWGINRETAQFEQVSLLTMSGYDTRGTVSQSDDRGRYTVPSVLPALRRALVSSSRWRAQLGAKYVF